MDAPSFFGSANAHFVNEDYEEAIKHFTCAVTLQEDCAEYRANRAACYLKLGKFAEALEDAEAAVKISDKCHMGAHWKGIALFYMGCFAEAKAAFEASLRMAPSSKAPRALWVRKCDAELSGSTLPLSGAMAEASTAPAKRVVQDPAPAAAPVPVPAPTPAPTPAASAAPAPAPADAPASKTSISGRSKVRHEWYQNTSHVNITFFAKNVDQEKLTIDYKEKALSVAFPLPGSQDEEYQLDLDLFETIDPSACSVEVSKVKVEVKLAKKSLGLQWGGLEKKDEVAALPAAIPNYPTSNKAKRDWSQIERDTEAELKAEKPEGDEALNKLFRQIYENADDDTRRSMNKSFQTSGGTVLSTNWAEVAKADYEGKDRPTAPEGQVWADEVAKKK